MPVVVRIRDYDQSFYTAMGFVEGKELRRRADEGSKTLFGDG
jgi:hypothetical protein